MRDNKSHSASTKTTAKVSAARSSQAPKAKGNPQDGSIGFIGLGRMGSAMAANLVAGGRKVLGYLHRPEHKSELESLGIKTTVSLADLIGCDTVITMLPDDAAVQEVIFGGAASGEGLATGLKPGALHVSMSTISPELSSRLAQEHAMRGQNYVAAPVFGNPDAARVRELYVIAAGNCEQIERCRQIFELVSQRIFIAGSDPASANLVKLAGNSMIAASLEVMGEVLALLRKRGVAAENFIDIITNTMFGSRVHRIYGGKMAQQHYTPGFAFPLALKDVRLALANADAAGVPLPSLGVVHDRLLAGMARGHAGLDWSALALVAAEEAGLENIGSKKGN